MLKAVSVLSLQKWERRRTEKVAWEVNTGGLTAHCVQRKIKVMKTLYGQELNKIINSKRSNASTCDL
jgi:hypothetical protein